jgi:NAD(P)-dependent dehydrogenase (short-subunit alcohol dehydrogenase family)
MFSIAGRRTLITGGTAGIGLAVAAHFVSAGAHVVISGRRAEGAEIAASIGARHVAMDVRDDDSVEQGLDAAVALLGGLDVLILNAGVALSCGPVDDLDLDAFREVIDVNLIGVMRGLRFGLKHLRQGGVILATSSPAGRQPLGLPGVMAYSASKAALDLVVGAAGLQLAAKGIRITGILPGVIRSEIGGDGPGVPWLARMTATGEERGPEAMAPVYHFLASDAGAMLQGAVVAADDGCTAGVSAPVMARIMAG